MTEIVDLAAICGAFAAGYLAIDWLCGRRKPEPEAKPSRLVALPISGDVIERGSIVGITVCPPQRVPHPQDGRTIYTRARVLVGSSRYGSAFVIECDDLETAEGVRETVRRMAEGKDPPPPPDTKQLLEKVRHERRRTDPRS